MGQFEKWLQDNLIIVAGIFVGIALLQVRTMLMKMVESMQTSFKDVVKTEQICLNEALRKMVPHE